MRRLAFVVAAVVVLAGCGGSSHTTTTDHATAAAQAQIKSAYKEFYSSQTSIPDRVAVLENGPKFKGLVTSFANNPLAKNVSVTISSVVLKGENKARVVYRVKLGGAGLPRLTGTAVRENGTWKVGDASLCKLVSLGGSTPPVCKS